MASAKQGRDRKTQAILPLRGKVLNAEQATRAKVLANKELSNIVDALGCGLGEDLDVSKLRYHKVILLMDADADGLHIATLLLTFLYRYMKPLIDGGYVYIAQPPLFRVDALKETWWALDEADRDRIVARIQKKNPRTTDRDPALQGAGRDDAEDAARDDARPGEAPPAPGLHPGGRAAGDRARRSRT